MRPSFYDLSLQCQKLIFKKNLILNFFETIDKNSLILAKIMEWPKTTFKMEWLGKKSRCLVGFGVWHETGDQEPKIKIILRLRRWLDN